MIADTPERRLSPPVGAKPEYPVCPVCGSAAAEDFYFRNGECLGCEKCVAKRYYLDVNLS
jgi:hypothetical protein